MIKPTRLSSRKSSSRNVVSLRSAAVQRPPLSEIESMVAAVDLANATGMALLLFELRHERRRPWAECLRELQAQSGAAAVRAA